MTWMKILLMMQEIEENIEEMLDCNEVNQYLDCRWVMLDCNVVMIVMANKWVKLENIVVMLENIVAMLAKEKMYNQFDYQMVCKRENLENIEEMLVNIEVMLVNRLEMLANMLVMHYFHHDHLVNIEVMLENRLEMLDLKLLRKIFKIRKSFEKKKNVLYEGVDGPDGD